MHRRAVSKGSLDLSSYPQDPRIHTGTAPPPGNSMVRRLGHKKGRTAWSLEQLPAPRQLTVLPGFSFPVQPVLSQAALITGLLYAAFFCPGGKS